MIPPTTFGVVFVVQSSRPGSTRSGDIARWKSSPAFRPEPCSRIGCTISRVVPGQVVDSSTTTWPRCRTGARLRRGALDVGEVGLALARERRRQRDQDRVRVLDLLVVGRRDDQARLGQRREALGRDVLDVALAAVERVDDVRLDVDEQHAAARLGEGHGERQADVAGADDGDVVGAAPARRSSVQSGCDALGGVAVAVELGRVGRESRSRRASAAASSSGSTRTFAPAATVSTHSVLGRSVTHGTPSQYASFCRPPESVTTVSARARRARACRGSRAARSAGRVAASAMPCASSTCRVRGCAGKTNGPLEPPFAPRRSAAAAPARTFASRWIVSTA